MVVGAESEKQDKLWRIFKGNVVRSLKLSGSRKHTLSNKTSRFCAIASFWFDVIWLPFDFHFVLIQLPFVLQVDLTSVSVRHKTSKHVFSVYLVREHVPRLIDNFYLTRAICHILWWMFWNLKSYVFHNKWSLSCSTPYESDTRQLADGVADTSTKSNSSNRYEPSSSCCWKRELQTGIQNHVICFLKVTLG